MEILLIKEDILKVPADILVVNLFEGVEKPSPSYGGIDRALEGIISQEIKDIHFQGKEGEMFTVSTGGKIKAKRVLVVGLGDQKSFSEETIRRVSGIVIKNLRGKGIKTVATILHGAGIGGRRAKDAASALVEGALLAAYDFSKYRGKESKKSNSENIRELIIVENDPAKVRAAASGAEEAKIAAVATCYARDLVNEPASVCVPSHLVEHARAIAKASKGKVRVKIFDRQEIQRRGMGAFLAVAQGTSEAPYFIHLTYAPRGAKKRIALVGKGITFDSGGLQIKTGDSMATMKLDMSGAAAVLGVFSKITEIAPAAEVHGIIAATENMPGPGAYKPGDICRALNGKTIEIGHTDAEGRVTLADSLSYAVRLKPDAIIDLATLTGACMVALGEEITGLMTNNQKLGAKLRECAEECGEKIWELPLAPEYKPLIKGTHGDIKNSASGRYGGAITAGLFLQEFVDGIPWAHLDIAGPAWAERDTVPYIPKGGTGHGVRTLIKYLQQI